LAVSRQCAARHNREQAVMERIREALYKRVIGAEESETEQLVSQ
jgi:hypothetical protein